MFFVWGIMFDLNVWVIKVNFIRNMNRLGDNKTALLFFISLFYDFCIVYVAVIWPLLHGGMLVFLFGRLCIQFTSLHLLFFCQHRWDICYSEEKVNSDWGRYNAETCVSLSGSTGIMYYLPQVIGNLGTNPATLIHHLEHTLFPGVNYLYLPRVAKICNELCQKHKIPYNEVIGDMQLICFLVIYFFNPNYM